MTGSHFFPDGLATYTVSSNRYLTFEKGPSQTVQLQWATFYDAADQAGLSRLWGGIHVPVDDLTGRIVGSKCGQDAWALARRYFDGSVNSAPILPSTLALKADAAEVSFQALRGFRYALQSTPNLTHPFTNEPPGYFQALDSHVVRKVQIRDSPKLYRLVRASESTVP